MKGSQLMKQAQQMQAKLAALQKELEAREVEASAGGEMVRVKVNGKQQIVEITLDAECVDPTDIESLQDLIKTAVNQAVQMSHDMVSQAMSKVSGGLNIPGLF